MLNKKPGRSWGKRRPLKNKKAVDKMEFKVSASWIDSKFKNVDVCDIPFSAWKNKTVIVEALSHDEAYEKAKTKFVGGWDTVTTYKEIKKNQFETKTFWPAE